MTEQYGPDPSDLPPTPPFDLGITGEDLYESTASASYAETEPEVDFAWAKYMASLAELLDCIAVVTRPKSGEDPWIVMASPKRCPDVWLPVLAQWAGVRRPDSMSSEELRQVIGPHAPGMWRGTRQCMIAAVTRFMPPGTPPEQMLYFEENADGDPYKLRVFTYNFVAHDPEEVRIALLHEKPALLNLIYEVRTGQTWRMLNIRKTSWATITPSAYLDYPDYAAQRDDLPL